MLTQKKTLVFNKENDNRWYVECKKWEEEQTALFRETHVHLDADGKSVPYEKEQQLDNPLDDHTKHEEWRDPHADLVVNDSIAALLEQFCKKGSRQVKVEVLTYGWVSNTHAHYLRKSIGAKGCEYELRYDLKELPKSFCLTPLFCYIFECSFPNYLHVKLV